MSRTTTCLFCKAAFVCLPVMASAATPQAIDHGRLQGRESRTPISVTVTLALPRLAEAERLQQAIYTPGSPEYHRFLTAEQFVARFAPGDAAVANVVAALGKYGLSAERTTATTLKVTGMAADLERAFSTTLHSYEIPARGNLPGYTYHAPAAPVAFPAEVAKSVTAVFGLNNRPAFHSNAKRPPAKLHAAPGASTAAKTGDPFGSLTVTDFAAGYDVDPLYSAGMTGSGRTLGIITLAAFTPGDAYAYWAALGLNVLPNRISIVDIDGGPGAPSDASGSVETTLDVEQSGGIAPGAKIIVYQGPNTNQAFVDLFAAAIEDNTADSLSTSWGEWEWFDNLGNGPVNDPLGGGTVASTQAIHELLLRASIQGQSTFAAAGDGGAYDVNDDLGCPVPYSPAVKSSCSLTLSVDYPASDTMITAAGGTTLSGHQSYCLNAACTPPYDQVQIPQESVWGWDYLNGLCTRLGFSNPVDCGTFPGGGGGGVSVFFAAPAYQAGIAGTKLSEPGQAFFLQPFGLLYTLPSNFAGRNVPDVSFNADPETGYVVVYTSSVTGPGVISFYGGTSFVSPQLNGVTALLDQYVGKRVGLLNPALYGLVSAGAAYQGESAPLNAVAFGDNWFYDGTKGYNPGSGLGTLDVFNFARYLRGQF